MRLAQTPATFVGSLVKCSFSLLVLEETQFFLPLALCGTSEQCGVATFSRLTS